MPKQPDVLDLDALAKKAGVPKNTLKKRMELVPPPPPDGYVSGAPWWREATIGEWLARKWQVGIQPRVQRDSTWLPAGGRCGDTNAQIVARLRKLNRSAVVQDRDERAMYMAILWHRGWTVKRIGDATGLSEGRVHQLVALGRTNLAES